MAHPEKVPHRALDTRRAFAIPVRAEDKLAEIVRFVAGDRHPDVADAAGPAEIGHDGGGARSNRHAIRIAAGAVVAGFAAPLAITGAV